MCLTTVQVVVGRNSIVLVAGISWKLFECIVFLLSCTWWVLYLVCYQAKEGQQFRFRVLKNSSETDKFVIGFFSGIRSTTWVELHANWCATVRGRVTTEISCYQAASEAFFQESFFMKHTCRISQSFKATLTHTCLCACVCWVDTHWQLTLLVSGLVFSQLSKFNVKRFLNNGHFRAIWSGNVFFIVKIIKKPRFYYRREWLLLLLPFARLRVWQLDTPHHVWRKNTLCWGLSMFFPGQRLNWNKWDLVKWLLFKL